MIWSFFCFCSVCLIWMLLPSCRDGVGARRLPWNLCGARTENEVVLYCGLALQRRHIVLFLIKKASVLQSTNSSQRERTLHSKAMKLKMLELATNVGGAGFVIRLEDLAFQIMPSKYVLASPSKVLLRFRIISSRLNCLHCLICRVHTQTCLHNSFNPNVKTLQVTPWI